MREANIETQCVHLAETSGWLVRKVQWVGRKGAPDRLFIKDGRTVWVEFKRPGKTPGLLQETEHEDMRAAGAEVYAVDSVEGFYKVMGWAWRRSFFQSI